tara:strand:+ start:33 stop:938 length:906 start_codon:yes stop_codon:yes gene_type:complete
MSLTKTQLKERLGMITGSNAGTILGVNPYSSKYCMWATKTGLIVDDFKGNNKTDLGTALEDFCVKKYITTTGNKVRQVKRTLRHKKHKYIGGHIDGAIQGDKNRGLECKVVTPDGMAKWFADDGGLVVPAYYQAQVLHYALMTGRMIWDFSVVFTDGRRDPAILTIEFSKADLDDYLDKCIQFWKLVESNTPPSIDDSAATAEALKKQWQTTDPGSIKVATPEVMRHLKMRQAHKDKRDVYDAQVQLAVNRYMNYMEDAETLISPSGTILATSKPDKNNKRRNAFKPITEELTDGNYATAV